MNILFLSRWYPDPPDNGSKLRIFHLLRQLSEVYTVDLISFTSEPPDPEKSRGLSTFCRKIWTAEYIPFQPGKLGGVSGLFSSTPRSVTATFSAEMDQLVKTAVSENRYDVVIASQIDMIPYAARLDVPVRLLEEVELTSMWEQYAAQRNPFKRLLRFFTWQKLKGYLRRSLKDFHACTVVSDEERARLMRVVPRMKDVAVIPNGVDTAFMSGDFGPLEPDSLVYNGALTYKANYDAMAYFLQEIFPRIQSGRPGVRLYITGKTDGVRLDKLRLDSSVVFTGYLGDIRPRVATSWVNVVPLRQGGGTRLKILESLALGTPVVSTAKGAEGLHLRAGEDYLRADSPAAFADATLRLLRNEKMRCELSETGRKKVQDLYDWEIVGERLNDFIAHIAATAEQSPRMPVTGETITE